MDTKAGPVDSRTAAEIEAWRPIATAPKCGTPVLLWEPDAPFRHDGCAVIGTYVDFERQVAVPEGYHSGWFDTIHGHTEFHPTHWRPLPDPPHQEQDTP